MDNLLQEKPSIMLDEFLKQYNNIYNIDIEKAKNLIKLGIKYYDVAPYQTYLTDNWYKSLKTDKPAFNLYNDPYYFTDLWVCWNEYSRKYLRSITKNNSLTDTQSIYSIVKDCKSVADLGCGLGLTTSALTEIFPSATVYATNIVDTEQFKFCEYLSKKKKFILKEHYKELPKVDMIFASEYFEHIYDAFDEIYDIINNISPQFFYIANSFNTFSYGHFTKYKNFKDNKTLDQKYASKAFNYILRNNGYTKLKTKLWNNKPTLWRKN